ncbi:MAG: NUDIX hydrolase [Phycisphaerales bacterium]|jgi:8-oxo-dGTP pyrophosphatase MutT (NUDIX family)
MDATTYDDIPGIELWPVDASVHVEVARDGVPETAASDSPVGREWARLCATNPRMFDGTLLSVRGFDAASGQILAKRERYQRLAVQPQVQTGVRLLAVTALVMQGEGDDARVLLGRRGDRVRMYPGMWEFGPSGGVDSPPLSIDRLDVEHLRSHLADEISEELGPGALDSLGAAVESAEPIALTRDHMARSDDVCFAVSAQGGLNPHDPNWEYSEVRWLTPKEAAAFNAAEPDAIIPPTRALMRFLGWVM